MTSMCAIYMTSMVTFHSEQCLPYFMEIVAANDPQAAASGRKFMIPLMCDQMFFAQVDAVRAYVNADFQCDPAVDIDDSGWIYLINNIGR